MDAEYLRQNVGTCLSECLVDVCMKRPADPIEYIAHWLYKHTDNVKAKNQELADREELKCQQEEYRLEQERLERQRLEQERIAREEEERKKAMEAEAAAQAAAALATVAERDEPTGTIEEEEEEEEGGEEEETEEDGSAAAAGGGDEAAISLHSVAEADEDKQSAEEDGD